MGTDDWCYCDGIQQESIVNNPWESVDYKEIVSLRDLSYTFVYQGNVFAIWIRILV